MNVKTAIVVTIIIFASLFVYAYLSSQDDTIRVYNPSDNKTYQVRRANSLTAYTPLNALTVTSKPVNDDTRTAVQYLAELNTRINTLVDYMYTESLPNIYIAQRLKSRWSRCKLRETSSWDSSVASTINKGTELRICIRGADGFEDMNTSMFVILHELAHIMSESYGHNDEFYENFSYVTHLASYLGLYKPENFALKPKTYCGFSIKTTPCSEGTCVYNDKN
jgi:hypothetical protein